MTLFQVFNARFRSPSDWIEAAERIADQTFNLIWQRVSERVLDMSAAETRGYVRARAGGILKNVVHTQPETRGNERIYAMAMDATVRRVTNQAIALQTRQLRKVA